MNMIPASLRRSFTVFELVNERLHEIYVARTDGPIFGVVDALRRRTPPAIAHWDLIDTRPVRSLEFGLSETEAQDFVLNCVRAKLPEGWRYLT